MDFVKLQGTGNDFVVLDARRLDRDWETLARAMCDRHFGIGGDGLILAAPSDVADVRMRIFNADGSEAEMSGNGMRCLVKFVVDTGIVSPRDEEFDVETGAGVLRVRVVTQAGRVTRVREGMGRPHLDPRDIPVAIPEGEFDFIIEEDETLPVSQAPAKAKSKSKVKPKKKPSLGKASNPKHGQSDGVIVLGEDDIIG
ncbi:MAG: diaminopimelate epimerase [Dehalococcoidia bacterium]